MRLTVQFAASVVALGGFLVVPVTAQKDVKKDSKSGTPAAEVTRTKALKGKVTVAFSEARLGDVLKEFAAQIDMKADVQLMWAYGEGFPFAQKVTYSCKDKPLETALDELFRKAGTLGYIVVSKDGDKRDGWVLLTTTGERGSDVPLPKATEEEETEAAARLKLAKSLLDKNENDKAKTVLAYILKKYPGAKAATEAKELMSKLEK